MIQFTPEKYQEKPENNPGLSAVITWIFRKMAYCLMCLMVAAWFCAAIYSITRQDLALCLMLISFLITIIILSAGLVLLAALLVIAFVSNLTRTHPEPPKDQTAEILYLMPGKEPEI